ncbi:MAG: glycosyltransferase, partial [Alphaproteobacteria bacterium]|nr:glycosyltransferase [Alphaproteobacteria bacterium]
DQFLSERKPDAPINIVYSGDARLEKGYQYLSDIVSGLWKPYVANGRVRFSFQSNFNVPGGEPGIADTRNQLSSYGEDKGRLFCNPMSDGDYYRNIGSADLVLIPYDRVSYGARSSGVLAEALAAGKPVVVPSGTWMADQIDGSCGRVFDSPEDFCAAVRDAVDHFDELAEGAQKKKDEWRKKHNPEELVAHLWRNQASSSAAVPNVPSVLVVMDAEAVALNNGAATVFSSQISYLSSTGYRVYAVLALSTLTDSHKAREATVDALYKSMADLPVVRTWISQFVFKNVFSTKNPRILKSLLKSSKSLESVLAQRSLLAAPESLAHFCRERSPDVVLLNYVTNEPVLRALGLSPSVPVICETHDIQSHQLAIYGKRPVFAADLSLEFNMLDRFKAVIAINDAEEDIFNRRLRSTTVYWAPPIVQTARASYANLAGASDLQEVIRMSGPSATGKSENISAIDLLYVSSNHIPNVTSFLWFYDTVYIPFLQPLGIHVVVAGTVSEILKEKIRNPGKTIHFLGRVTDLAPLYAACKVVILPIVSGAGTCIKTIEALGYGKPCAGTQLAFRGIGKAGQLFPVGNAPPVLAQDIVALLQNSAARTERRNVGDTVLKQSNVMSQRRKVFDDIFADILGDKALPPRAQLKSPNTETDAPLVEWDFALEKFNRIMRKKAEGLPTGPLDDAPLRPGDKERLKAAYQAFFVDRTAAVLEMNPLLKARMDSLAQTPSFEELLAEGWPLVSGIRRA